MAAAVFLPLLFLQSILTGYLRQQSLPLSLFNMALVAHKLLPTSLNSDIGTYESHLEIRLEENGFTP